MSKTVTLCGVVHRNTSGVAARTYLHARVQPIFDEQLLPKITNDSVIIIEGHNRSANFTDSHYGELLQHLGEKAFQSVRPQRIVGCDPRWKSKRTKANFFVAADSVLKATREKLRFEITPRSFEGLVVCVKEGKVPYSLTSPFTRDETQAIRELRKACFAFDALCVRRIRDNSDSDRFVLAGIAHCLRLHVQYGWELENLLPEEWNTEYPDFFADVYNMYAACYLWVH